MNAPAEERAQALGFDSAEQAAEHEAWSWKNSPEFRAWMTSVQPQRAAELQAKHDGELSEADLREIDRQFEARKAADPFRQREADYAQRAEIDKLARGEVIGHQR